MVKVELSPQQLEGLLQLIDKAPIAGNAAEFIVELKTALRASLQESQAPPTEKKP